LTDIWFGCPQDPPRNVSASLVTGGLDLSWDAVSPVLGFDPSDSIPQGFYHLEMWDDTFQEHQYGAQSWLTSHLIPENAFGGFAPGSPDGFDFGKSLDELEDGAYTLVVFAFAEAPQGDGGVRLECHVRAQEEEIHLEISGDTITLLP
jgi:hypothetical protein